MNLAKGTFLRDEEVCYPDGKMRRKGAAIHAESGRLVAVRAGIADTYFTVPARSGKERGFLTVEEDGEGRFIVFHPRGR